MDVALGVDRGQSSSDPIGFRGIAAASSYLKELKVTDDYLDCAASTLSLVPLLGRNPLLRNARHFIRFMRTHPMETTARKATANLDAGRDSDDVPARYGGHCCVLELGHPQYEDDVQGGYIDVFQSDLSEIRVVFVEQCNSGYSSGTVFGIVSEATTSPVLKRYIGAYMVIAITLNIIITLLTIGRILFIAREVKLLMGKKMVSHYNFAVGVLVESGLLYTASFILTIALSRTYFILVAAAISIRMVCIVPILLVVQIALGQTTKSVEATVSSLRVTTSPIVLDTIVTVGGEDESESAAHRLPRIEDVESRKSSGHLVE
ncbi:hypothetical protein D9613_010650 [Agrocybe pediades]|uniref:Uncharacterized protein n=1 Tax=Agrocybe pediades TaxID=84607 RepID=A0A8H4VJB0_9AGAR|nr:hypothetical protein D9613_010650 [Agrocybe pediades]